MKELEQACRVLRQAVAADAPAAHRHRAARQVLLAYGAEALGLTAAPAMTLPELVRIAAAAHATPERRNFAILLLHALGVPGLVRPRGRRSGGLDQDICHLAETAIAAALLRAGYNFTGTIYDRIGFLERLHTELDEHLRPFEPTFPPWLHGLERR